MRSLPPIPTSLPPIPTSLPPIPRSLLWILLIPTFVYQEPSPSFPTPKLYTNSRFHSSVWECLIDSYLTRNIVGVMWEERSLQNFYVSFSLYGGKKGSSSMKPGVRENPTF